MDILDTRGICSSLNETYVTGLNRGSIVEPDPGQYRIPVDQFERHVMPLFDRYWPVICDARRDKESFLASFRFHEELRAKVNHYPMEWFAIFRDLFRAGVFGPLAWGPMVRSIYATATPIGVDANGEYFDEFLTELREFSGHSLMLPSEWKPFDELPELITVYRGSLVATADQAFRGISWSLRRQYADFHVTRRFGQSDFRTGANTGRVPLLVSATIPRDFVFAYLSTPGDDEILVDFERIEPARVKKLPRDDWMTNTLNEIVSKGFAKLTLPQGGIGV